MKKILIRHLIPGMIFVSILGTLSHFFYDWSNQNTFVAFFSPINESTWEHMKLVFFPMLLFTWYLSEKYPDNDSVMSAALSATLFGTFLVPVLYYTYSGILGFRIAAIDISIFYISVLAAFSKIHCILSSVPAPKKKETQNQCSAPSDFSGKLSRFICCNEKLQLLSKNLLLIITLLVCILFFVFTLKQPALAIFAEP